MQIVPIKSQVLLFIAFVIFSVPSYGHGVHMKSEKQLFEMINKAGFEQVIVLPNVQSSTSFKLYSLDSLQEHKKESTGIWTIKDVENVGKRRVYYPDIKSLSYMRTIKRAKHLFVARQVHPAMVCYQEYKKTSFGLATGAKPQFRGSSDWTHCVVFPSLVMDVVESLKRTKAREEAVNTNL